MDLGAFLLTFAVIFPAELPDKSMITAIILGSRYRALPVWLGLATAFLVHVLIATTAGSLLTRLPEVVVAGVVALFFLVFAVLLLRAGEDDDETTVGERGDLSVLRIFAIAFLAVFVTEWGDLTQLATIGLTARYDDPVSVGLGSITALWLISGLGVLFGSRLLARLPVKRVKQISGVVLLLLAGWAAIDFFRLL